MEKDTVFLGLVIHFQYAGARKKRGYGAAGRFFEISRNFPEISGIFPPAGAKFPPRWGPNLPPFFPEFSGKFGQFSPLGGARDGARPDPAPGAHRAPSRAPPRGSGGEGCWPARPAVQSGNLRVRGCGWPSAPSWATVGYKSRPEHGRNRYLSRVYPTW